MKTSQSLNSKIEKTKNIFKMSGRKGSNKPVKMPKKAARKEMSTKEAYFTSLSEWARHSSDLQMYFNFLNCRTVSQEKHRLTQQAAKAEANARQPRDLQSDMELVRVLDGEQRRRIIQQWGGTEMIVAPFWKRLVAEVIDVGVLIVLKIVWTLMFHLYSNLHFGNNLLSSVNEALCRYADAIEDAVININFEYQFKYVCIGKMIICLYDCFWTIYNNGSTPGKYLMNIRLVHVETMVALDLDRDNFDIEMSGYWALICPAITPSGLRTLCRVLIKSIISVMFFPLCIILMFPRNNRTTYDIITKTLVVEMNTERPPTLPRPRAR